MSERTDDPKVTALRSDIAQTRAELGATVEALTQRVDVKARAKEKVDEAKQKARESAQHAAASGRELARELRSDPGVPARRAAVRMRTSVRQHPKEWVAAMAGLLAFAALVVRKRRRAAARRLTPESLRADWRKQWRGAE
jgi:hypothetical protein